MKTIEVEDNVYNFLIELSKEMNTQDNRATADPFYYTIQVDEEVVVAEGYGDDIVYYKEEFKIRTEEEAIGYLANYIYDCELFQVEDRLRDESNYSWYDVWDKLEELNFTKFDVRTEHRHKGFFLTESECNNHIKANAHHYDNPVSYVEHAWRAPKVEQLFKFLKELTNK